MALMQHHCNGSASCSFSCVKTWIGPKTAVKELISNFWRDRDFFFLYSMWMCENCNFKSGNRDVNPIFFEIQILVFLHGTIWRPLHIKKKRVVYTVLVHHSWLRLCWYDLLRWWSFVHFLNLMEIYLLYFTTKPMIFLLPTCQCPTPWLFSRHCYRTVPVAEMLNVSPPSMSLLQPSGDQHFVNESPCQLIAWILSGINSNPGKGARGKGSYKLMLYSN